MTYQTDRRNNTAQARPTPNRLSIGEPGLQIIRRHDPFWPEPCLHRRGYHAIGYAHRIRDWGIELLDPPIDRATAEDLLRRQDLPAIELYLNATTHIVLAQHEFDALGSLIFDVGIRAFERSPLRASLNAGHRDVVAGEFLRFDSRAFGKAPDRDTRQRRSAEMRLFLGPPAK